MNTVGDGSNGYPISRIRLYKNWVNLTEEEIEEMAEFHFLNASVMRAIYDDIATKLQDKNHG